MSLGELSATLTQEEALQRAMASVRAGGSIHTTPSSGVVVIGARNPSTDPDVGPASFQGRVGTGGERARIVGDLFSTFSSASHESVPAPEAETTPEGTEPEQHVPYTGTLPSEYLRGTASYTVALSGTKDDFKKGATVKLSPKDVSSIFDPYSTCGPAVSLLPYTKSISSLRPTGSKPKLLYDAIREDPNMNVVVKSTKITGGQVSPSGLDRAFQVTGKGGIFGPLAPRIHVVGGQKSAHLTFLPRGPPGAQSIHAHEFTDTEEPVDPDAPIATGVSHQTNEEILHDIMSSVAFSSEDEPVVTVKKDSRMGKLLSDEKFASYYMPGGITPTAGALPGFKVPISGIAQMATDLMLNNFTVGEETVSPINFGLSISTVTGDFTDDLPVVPVSGTGRLIPVKKLEEYERLRQEEANKKYEVVLNLETDFEYRPTSAQRELIPATLEVIAHASLFTDPPDPQWFTDTMAQKKVGAKQALAIHMAKVMPKYGTK